MAQPIRTIGNMNITRVIPVDLSEGDFIDENGFFIRAGTAGIIKYCPFDNKSDAEAITKNFAASDIFIDPEVCRKIFDIGTVSPPQAENIYIGYGV